MPSFVVFPDTQSPAARTATAGRGLAARPPHPRPRPAQPGGAAPMGPALPCPLRTGPGRRVHRDARLELARALPARRRARSPCSCTATSCADTRSPSTPSAGSWPRSPLYAQEQRNGRTRHRAPRHHRRPGRPVRAARAEVQPRRPGARPGDRPRDRPDAVGARGLRRPPARLAAARVIHSHGFRCPRHRTSSCVRRHPYQR